MNAVIHAVRTRRKAGGLRSSYAALVRWVYAEFNILTDEKIIMEWCDGP